MMISLMVFGALVVWAVAASVVVVLRDGYRAVPACETEGKRNRLRRDSVGG